MREKSKASCFWRLSWPIGPHCAPSSETPAFEWMLSDTKRADGTGTKQNKQERRWGVVLDLNKGGDRWMIWNKDASKVQHNFYIFWKQKKQNKTQLENMAHAKCWMHAQGRKKKKSFRLFYSPLRHYKLQEFFKYLYTLFQTPCFFGTQLLHAQTHVCTQKTTHSSITATSICLNNPRDWSGMQINLHAPNRLLHSSVHPTEQAFHWL